MSSHSPENPSRPTPSSGRPKRVPSFAKPSWVAGLVALGLVSAAIYLESEERPAVSEAAEFVLKSGTRQLTFEGRRAGEGYFSADGTKMIFQSEREEGNPFYQIYLLDLETGDTERISPGHGKTTCAWIHPDGKRVLFASTHADPESEALQAAEYEERESATARRYEWDYDPEFEIYEYHLEEGTYTNLTNIPGYDAEGAYSPDGSKIVFASNRQAYDGSLSEADQKAFKLDRKFAIEIYVADADGSNVQRLTENDGYDGGPFFSADGTRICWRRFDRKGTTAEIYTMAIDGSDQRQLTGLGAMSWAPFFHPSGEYLIFATNLHGFDNFELYLVDAAGEKEPIRVTDSVGFDGLPVFSPDGETLSWTSNRTPEKQSQIFLAKWHHETVLAALAAAPARESSGEARGEVTAAPEAPSEAAEVLETPVFETSPTISIEDLSLHLEYLASEELEGRLTGTRGERLATQHFAASLERFGLLPWSEDEGYFQPFDFTAGVDLGEDNRLSLTLGGEAPGPLDPLEPLQPVVDEEWRPISFSRTGEFNEAGIVFAGYGLEVPDGSGGESYTSYFHLDVKGKWVMVLRYAPEGIDEELRREMQRHSRLRSKAAVARRKFAAGIIFVTGPEAQVNEDLVPMQFDASLADSGIPAISMSTEMASRLLAAAGKDLGEIQRTLNTGEMVQGFELPGAAISGKIDIAQERRTGRNVLGILSAGQEGPHPLPAVVVGAHIDHLGPDAGTGSLAREDERHLVHRGADDNASGIAALLEIAEHLAEEQRQGRLELKRDVVFAAWSGEELGLLGSNYFVRTLARDTLGDESAPLGLLIGSYLNMDMVGRLDEKLVLQGIGSSDAWEGIIERRNAPVGLPITIQRDTFLPTDATSFYLRKVPILSAFTGAHAEYHTPRDTPDLINYDGLKDITRLFGLITRELATSDEAPRYVQVEPPRNLGARGFRVYLGTIPDYSQGEVQGVKLSGVAEKGPAGVAGVQTGDVIVGLGGKKVLNIYDYTEALAGLTVGEEAEITVQRGDEEITLPIVPGSRD